jgi:hypothetical protein
MTVNSTVKEQRVDGVGQYIERSCMLKVYSKLPWKRFLAKIVFIFDKN